MAKRLILLTILAVAFASCSRVIFSENYDLHDGWPKDSVLTFDFEIEQAPATHQVEIVVRNNDEFAYQNLWLFVETESENGNVQRDTVQFFVADALGRWTGSGIGSIFENRFVYKPKFRFKTIGNQRISIQHALREDTLFGLESVGIRIE